MNFLFRSTLPAPPTFKCPSCDTPVEAKADYLARGMKCPECKTSFIPLEIKRHAKQSEGAPDCLVYTCGAVIIIAAFLVHPIVGCLLVIIALLLIIASRPTAKK